MWHSLGMRIRAANSLWKDQDYTEYTPSLGILWQRQRPHHPGRCIKDWSQSSLVTRGSTSSLCIQNIERYRAQVLQHRKRATWCSFWAQKAASLYIWKIYHSRNWPPTSHKHLEENHRNIKSKTAKTTPQTGPIWCTHRIPLRQRKHHSRCTIQSSSP